MPRPRILLTAAAFLSTFVFADAERPLGLDIAPDGWGDAQVADIKAVLHSAGNEIWRHCGGARLDSIHVHPRKDYPQTNWDRNDRGQIVIGLSTRDRYWAQYSFQFAHELAHALAIHANDWESTWRDSGKPNHWLEESLCEAASLFTLRAMGKSWRENPPYPNWRSFAPALAGYAQERLDDPRHQLPAGKSFLEWFRDEERSLRKNPVQREKNTLIASQLLPIFEGDPASWEALTCLNLGPRDRYRPLDAFLRDWQKRCPDRLRASVAKISAVFGVTL